MEFNKELTEQEQEKLDFLENMTLRGMDDISAQIDKNPEAAFKSFQELYHTSVNAIRPLNSFSKTYKTYKAILETGIKIQQKFQENNMPEQELEACVFVSKSVDEEDQLPFVTAIVRITEDAIKCEDYQFGYQALYQRYDRNIDIYDEKYNYKKDSFKQLPTIRDGLIKQGDYTKALDAINMQLEIVDQGDSLSRINILNSLKQLDSLNKEEELAADIEKIIQNETRNLCIKFPNEMALYNLVDNGLDGIFGKEAVNSQEVLQRKNKEVPANHNELSLRV